MKKRTSKPFTLRQATKQSLPTQQTPSSVLRSDLELFSYLLTLTDKLYEQLRRRDPKANDTMELIHSYGYFVEYDETTRGLRVTLISSASDNPDQAHSGTETSIGITSRNW